MKFFLGSPKDEEGEEDSDSDEDAIDKTDDFRYIFHFVNILLQVTFLQSSKRRHCFTALWKKDKKASKRSGKSEASNQQGEKIKKRESIKVLQFGSA